ncbi:MULTISPECIES: ssDNA-binding protein [unclassified Labrenzia]|uniref:ssDNA-binding protein n=1 Tax=unclassified Labrenzia TaxID=2648686 RepID=UPI0009DF0593|nr:MULTISPECIES: ssDNA-binding protein [unclassified Labrenzia]
MSVKKIVTSQQRSQKLASDDPCKVQLRKVRLSHPHLFSAKAFNNDPDGKKAFSASFLIPDDTREGEDMIADIEDAIEAAKEKEFGKKIPKIKADNIAFREGDDDRPETKNHMVVAARNYKRPRVLDRDKTDLHEEDGVIYGGCYVDGIVRFWAQKYNGIPRVNCSLEAVRFREDGEPFGAAPIDPDEFDDLDDDRPSRRSRRNRDDEDEDEDDRSSRRSRRSRDDEDEDDDRSSRRSRRSRDDEDEDGDDRSSRRSRRSRDDEDEDEDDRSSRRSRRSRDDDEEEDDRSSRRSRRSRDDDDEDDDRSSRRSRRSRDEEDEDDDVDRPSRNSRSRRRRDDDL